MVTAVTSSYAVSINCVHDCFFSCRVSDTFVGKNETATHLNAFCTHEESSSNSATITDTACYENRNIFYVGKYVFHQSHSGLFANVTASFHTFNYHCVCTSSSNALSQFYVGNNGNNFNASILEFFNERNGVACAQSYESRFFFADNFNNFINIGSHKHYVYAEGFISQRFCFTDIFAYPFCSSTTASNDACTTSIGNCGSQASFTGPSHATLDNGVFNA